MSAKRSVLYVLAGGGMLVPLHTQFRNCERSREAPAKWGLKKGARRARRRIEKEIIREEVEELDEGRKIDA